MKAIVLAAGRGVRLKPLTDFIPKVLINIKDKPFLYYVLKNLKKAGYAEIGLVVGYKKNKIIDFLKEFKINGITIIEQKEPLGTGHAVSMAKNFVKGENFIVCNGDNLYPVADLEAFKKEDNLNYISGVKVKDPSRYGVMVTKNGFLKNIVEKPKKFVNDLIYTGLGKFTPEIFESLKKIKFHENGEMYVVDAINLLASQKKVKVVVVDSWIDLGTVDDIPIVEKQIKNGSKKD